MMNMQFFIRQLFFLMLLPSMLFTSASFGSHDMSYLQGYLSALFENKLNWQKDSFHIDIYNSVATITVINKNEKELSKASRVLANVPDLIDFNFVDNAETETPEIPSFIHYPQGDYFYPSIAEIKEPQFFISFLNMETNINDVLTASIGLGQSFGLYRWPTSLTNNGWQLGFFIGLFSQFNLDEQSDPLINSDYIIGLPLSFRNGNFSGRFRLMHQSSHLGDEFLLSGNAPPRINLSYELIDMMIAYHIQHYRILVGASQLLSYSPESLKERAYTAAIDYRNPRPFIGNSRFISGIQTYWLEQKDWSPGTSIKFGIEIGQTYPHRHGTRIMFEAYDGFSPFGQFFDYETQYYGLGLYFDFN